MAKLIEVIVTHSLRGSGKDEDPIRLVMEYWSKDGKLLCEHDPLAPQYNIGDSSWTVPAWMKTKVGALLHYQEPTGATEN